MKRIRCTVFKLTSSICKYEKSRFLWQLESFTAIGAGFPLATILVLPFVSTTLLHTSIYPGRIHARCSKMAWVSTHQNGSLQGWGGRWNSFALGCISWTAGHCQDADWEWCKYEINPRVDNLPVLIFSELFLRAATVCCVPCHVWEYYCEFYKAVTYSKPLFMEISFQYVTPWIITCTWTAPVSEHQFFFYHIHW